jgi:hypothetical protein
MEPRTAVIWRMQRAPFGSGVVGPEEGDLIITTQHTTSQATYLLHQWKHAPELLCTSHADVLEIATAYAREQHVSVWYSEGKEFVLTEWHRQASAPACSSLGGPPGDPPSAHR